MICILLAVVVGAFLGSQVVFVVPRDPCEPEDDSDDGPDWTK